jgi:flagellar hook protein FlgE
MSLYGALFTGVSGLKSQSSKLAALSDNIANVNTIGYKRVDAQFETLVLNTALPNGAYSPGGVLPNNRQDISVQGQLISTDSQTDIAVSGKGLIPVNAFADSSDTPAYTRAGSFRADANGNFVNANGFFLQAWALDQDGNIPPTFASVNSLETVNVRDATGSAVATTTVEMRANLDASEDIFPGIAATASMDAQSASNFGIAADDLIVPSEFGLATTNSITRQDQFTVTTGEGLSYDYEYGGFTIGRDIATAGSANVGDNGVDISADITLAAGDLVTAAAGSNSMQLTIPGHNLIDGDTITISGVGPDPFDGIPASEINTVHTITRIDENTVSFTTLTPATAGAVANAGGGTVDARQFIGNAFDAITINESFLNNIGITGFTSGALTFTITTPTTGAVTYTYVTSSPSTASGQFNSLNNLATAIDETVGLTARVVNNRLVVGSEDANEAVTFANGDDNGTDTLRGLDWITELGLTDITASTNRFSTLNSLAARVNEDPGISAEVTNPLASSSISIRVDNPLDTIELDDFVQTPVTPLQNDPLTSAAGGPGAVTVTVSDTAHGLQVGETVDLQGIAAFDAFLASELNTTHTITSVIDANTYTISVTTAAAQAGATGGGNSITRSQVNNGSLVAELGLVESLSGGAYAAQSTGVLGPLYDTSGAAGSNMASGDVEAQFSRTIQIFDALGEEHNVRFDVIKTDENTWAAEIYAVPADDVNTTLVDGQIATGTIEFNGDGTLRSVSNTLTAPVNIIWTNGAVPSTVSFDWGTAGNPIGSTGIGQIGATDGLSQFDANYNVEFVNQNGSPVGSLVGVSIDDQGIVTASFTNGSSLDLYKIPLASFANPDGLKTVSANVFLGTRESGDVNLSEAGNNGTGEVVSGALEASNVQLDAALTDMIVAQRAYQSNTRIISTTDELLDQLNRI